MGNWWKNEGSKGPNDIPLLWGGGADAHGAVTAVNTLHLVESAQLVGLVGEADEAISAGLASVGVGHDLRALARREAALEQRHEDVLGDLRTKITDKDGELGAAIVTEQQELALRKVQGRSPMNIPSVDEAATRSPVQLELLAVAARDASSSQGQSLVSGVSIRELDEAVTRIAENMLVLYIGSAARVRKARALRSSSKSCTRVGSENGGKGEK